MILINGNGNLECEDLFRFFNLREFLVGKCYVWVVVVVEFWIFGFGIDFNVVFFKVFLIVIFLVMVFYV